MTTKKMQSRAKILIYGYGNPGRQDDGLGNAVVEQIEAWVAERQLQDISTDSNYQLNIEDATVLSEMDVVLFVDASMEDFVSDFYVSKLKPSPKVEFTMHAVSPSFVLHLCESIYNKTPDTYLMHIKGYEWEFREELSTGAKENLEKAVNFIKNALLYPDLFRVKDVFQRSVN